MNNFWEKFKKPVLILAPMEDVTDTVFRRIVASCGKPDVFFTEFTSTDAMCSPGLKRVADRLKFDKSERPIVAQIWGSSPDKFREAAKIVAEMGFDGIDINMGCPVKDVTKTGACSALIKNPDLAKKIIDATREGAPNLPISVKTRIGFSVIETEKWVTTLLEQDLSALTLHLRTAREMSKVPAHWDEIAKAIKIRNKMKVKTLIIGNGDVKSRKEALNLIKKYKIDGIMIGRGIFEDMWIFNKKINLKEITSGERFELLKKHITLFDKTWKKTKNFNIMKKFFKAYVNGFNGASDVRVKLMNTSTPKEALEIISQV